MKTSMNPELRAVLDPIDRLLESGAPPEGGGLAGGFLARRFPADRLTEARLAADRISPEARFEQAGSEARPAADGAAPAPPLAAFDADGTLWPGDVNDRLLRYQAKHNLREVKDLLDPVKYREEKQRAWRCREFARRQAGFCIEEIKEQLRAALKEEPLPAFPFQRELISCLKERGFRIFVVTASVQWLVEEAVSKENLPADRIIGIRTRLQKGRLTDQIERPITIGEGKREAFLQLSGGRPPLFAAGDSPGDKELLESASLSLLVQSGSAEKSPAAPSESGGGPQDPGRQKRICLTQEG